MTARLPAPGGPHPVGLRIAEFSAGSRRVQAYVWYPAEPQDRDPGPRALRTPAEAEALAAALARLGAGPDAAPPGRTILTHAAECLTPREGRWPLVVFNHGGALDPLANVTLMEELASAGYVAAALGHAGESTALVWKDGSTSLIDPALVARMQLPQEALADFARFLLARDETARHRYLARFRANDPGVLKALAEAWAGDAIAFVDLISGPAPPPALRGIAANLAPDRLCYAGMSLGGAAAFAACRRDRRAAAGVNLDGTIWDFAAIDTELCCAFLDIAADPALLTPQIVALTGEPAPTGAIGHANDFHYETPARRGARGEIVRLAITGAAHHDFTDRPLAEALAADIPAHEAPAILTVNRLCRAFLDWRLGGAGADGFQAAIAADPRVRRR